MMRPAAAAAAVVLLQLLLASVADAHDLRPGILAFVEDEPGELRMRFVPPIDSRGEAIELALILPDGCTRTATPAREMGSVPISEMGSVPISAQRESEMGSVPISAQRESGSVPISAQRETGSLPISAQRETGSVPISAQRETGSVPISAQPSALTDGRVRCKRGFGGLLAIGGMRGHAMKIYVSHERDGARRDWVITSDAPRLDLGPAPSVFDRIGLAALLLLVGLVLVFGPSVRLVAAALSFVAAEALAGFLPHVGSLEVVALASTVFVAREATHDGLTAIRRWPWLVGALLGAVHGLAFAPRPVYLAAQLGVVAVGTTIIAIATRSVGEGRIIRLRAHRAACYALGALAACWLIAHLTRG